MSESRDLRRAFIVDDAGAAPPPRRRPGEEPLPTRVVAAVEVLPDDSGEEAEPRPKGVVEPRRRPRLTPLRLFIGAAGAALVLAAGVDAWRFLAGAFASSITLGVVFAILFALVIAAAAWTVAATRRDLRELADVDAVRAQAQRILDGGDEHDLAGPELVAALAQHYQQHPQLRTALQEYQDRVDSSLPARWQVEQLSRQVFAQMDRVAFDTVKRHSQQAALLAMLSRVPMVDFLIGLWRSVALVRQIARTYGVRPGAAGLWRLWRGVLGNVVYANVSEVAADTLSQVLGGGFAAKISGQAAQGLGMGLLIGRLGLEAIRASRPLPFTGLEATRPSLKVLGEGMLQLVKSGLTKTPP